MPGRRSSSDPGSLTGPKRTRLHNAVSDLTEPQVQEKEPCKRRTPPPENEEEADHNASSSSTASDDSDSLLLRKLCADVDTIKSCVLSLTETNRTIVDLLTCHLADCRQRVTQQARIPVVNVARIINEDRFELPLRSVDQLEAFERQLQSQECRKDLFLLLSNIRGRSFGESVRGMLLKVLHADIVKECNLSGKNGKTSLEDKIFFTIIRDAARSDRQFAAHSASEVRQWRCTTDGHGKEFARTEVCNGPRSVWTCF